MDNTDRRVVESPLYQGADEIIAYTLTTTPWVSTPASPTVKIFNSVGTDTSGTNLSGSASAANDVITTPLVTSLTAGERYRLEIKWTASGNTWEAWADVYGQT